MYERSVAVVDSTIRCYLISDKNWVFKILNTYGSWLC